MRNTIETILARVIKLTGDGCWLWQGFIDEDGYGHVSWQGKTRLVHRVVYELLVGPIPEGTELDHTCRVTHCCRPDHLEPVTKLVNIERSEVGRHNRLKTQCPHGHRYTKKNTYARRNAQGYVLRQCRTCRRERNRKAPAKATQRPR